MSESETALKSLIEELRPYVQKVYYDAEAEYDNEGEFQDDYGLYETMQEAKAMMDRIDIILKK